MRLRCLSSYAFYDFVDHVVRHVNAPRGPLNQCEHWREVGGSSQNKVTDEPSDVSEVANNTLDVPEQVPGKKRDAVRNIRDASVLEKLKTSSVEDIILDETKTQIVSIAGVDYSSLSAKVRLHFCREKEERGNYRIHFESRKRVSIERDHQAAHEEEIKSCKDSPSSIDEGWNAILHHQHDMIHGRTTAFSEHQASNVMCYFR